MKELYLVKDNNGVHVITEDNNPSALSIMRCYRYGYIQLEYDVDLISCDWKMLEELKDEWHAFYNNPAAYDKTTIAECVFQWCENRYDERAMWFRR